MTLALTYSVTSIKVKDEVNNKGDMFANVVCQAHWKVVGTNINNETGEFSSATVFSALNVLSDNFKDFADLQEEDVISWIKNDVESNADYKSYILTRIKAQIDAEKPREINLPWTTSKNDIE